MNTQEVVTHKLCKSCEQVLPRSEFHRKTSAKDGLQSKCRPCQNAANSDCYYSYRDSRLINMKVHRAADRARKYGCENTLTISDLHELLEKFAWECAYCGEDFEVIDHVIPFSRGGDNTKSNVVPACNRCNVQKRRWDGSYRPTVKPLAA